MTRDRQRIVIGLLLAVLLLIAAEQFADTLLEYREALYWDLAIYRDAVLGTGDPYALRGDKLFIYHPIVLHAMRALGDQIELKLMMVYTGCAILYAYSIRRMPHAGLATFLAASFMGTGVAAVATGNIAPWLHLAILGLAALGFETRRDRVIFLIAVGLATIVKPYMLAFAGIPLIAAWPDKGLRKVVAIEVITLFAAVTLVVAGYALIRPEETQAFMTALRAQTIGHGDLGIGIYGRFALIASPPVAFALYVATVLAVAAAAIGVAIRQGRHRAAAFPFLLYFLAAVLNPRLKDYDLFPALIALYLYCLNLGMGWRGLAILIIGFVPAMIQLHGGRWFDIEHGVWTDPFNIAFASIALILAGLTLAGPLGRSTAAGAAPDRP